MKMDFLFYINSILFGIGLAMDAFSVSVADALNEPQMSRSRQFGIAGTFCAFQMLMPLTGWYFVRTAARKFKAFQKCIPWIALLLLLYIGGKMLLEGIRGEKNDETAAKVGFWGLMLQGVATSIDALSVGFTIADYAFAAAFTEALIIGAVTFAICLAGLRLGLFAGEKLSHGKLGGKASVLGGGILILIGFEIFIKAVFFS